MEVSISLAQLCKALRDMSDWHKIENGHYNRVASLSVAIGIKIKLSKEDLIKLKYTAEIHDIGRVGINDNILSKPGKLTDSEYGAVKSHTEIGYKIVRNILPPEMSLGILHHHERYDGTGYPKLLRGSNIPLFARIINIADYYDALTNKRPYREALSFENAIHIMNLDQSSFDPELYNIFLDVIKNKK
jgi:HD-GYP domain-containing protein (c-di-GMP phosphodiesterase class II)